MFQILVIICAVGATPCDENHNDRSWMREEMFSNVQECRDTTKHWMEEEPAPDTIQAKMVCVMERSPI